MNVDVHFADALICPARSATLITPSTAALATPLKALRAGADGTITLRGVGQDVDIVHPVFAGEFIPMRISHVIDSSPVMTIVGYA